MKNKIIAQVSLGKFTMTDLEKCLVVGVSSRSLFDLEEAHQVIERSGLSAYRQYIREHCEKPAGPGTAFPLVSSLLELNKLSPGRRLVEVIVLSHNQPETSLLIMNSIKHHQLDITRSKWGWPVTPWLNAFRVNLFLSANAGDVQDSVNAGIPAACISPMQTVHDDSVTDEIRIAFDGDAVLFGTESEEIFKTGGATEFDTHEAVNATIPLTEGPFAPLLKKLAGLKALMPAIDNKLRIGLFTARQSPADERVIRTLLKWGVYPDEAAFLGGLDKTDFLKKWRPHIFLDDGRAHVERAVSAGIPSGRVPWQTP